VRSGSLAQIASITSFPRVTSTGDGKYVGDENPYVPSTDEVVRDPDTFARAKAPR
jgi:hypothetical protein